MADFTMLNNVINATAIVGIDWLFGLAIAMFCLIMITRDTNKWKVLALPVMVGLNIIGIKQGIVPMIVAGLAYTIESIGIETVNVMVTKVGRTTNRIADETKKNAEAIKELRNIELYDKIKEKYLKNDKK